VAECNEDRGNWSLITLGELLGKVVEEDIFVLDLITAKFQRSQIRADQGNHDRLRTITLVLISAVKTENLCTCCLGVMLGSR